MPIINVITANEARKVCAQFVHIDHEYVINFILNDIRKYASEGRSFLCYDKQWVNEWFWEDATSYYCLNYFRNLGYELSVESHRYKINGEIIMIRW